MRLVVTKKDRYIYSVLFDENGKPTHIFCASGEGAPYSFKGTTYIVCVKLEKK